MPRFLVYLIYNLLLPVVLLLGLPSFLIKGFRRGGLARNFTQRLGWYKRETLAEFDGQRPIWIHAVSVGEILLAQKIVEALHARLPERKVVLSTTTTTGFSVACEQARKNVTVIHNPIDLPFVTARVIRLINPEQLILVEAEVWPNLVRQLKKRGVPVKLANARLSRRSQQRYLKFLPLIQPVFSLLDRVSVPFNSDVERWASLGIPNDRIQVLGNVKFDNTESGTDQSKTEELQQWLTRTGMPENHRILLAGSTHDGEEQLLASALPCLREKVPNLELVIVPRHAERGQEIANQLASLGFAPILKTALNRVESNSQQGSVEVVEPSVSKEKIWIANTTGELRAWYHLAEVVVIGKSFRGMGGQNPVEPILSGKPTVVGPHMQNFSEVVAELKSENGILQLDGDGALPDALEKLFEQPDESIAMAHRGAASMKRHRGAADRTVEFILT